MRILQNSGFRLVKVNTYEPQEAPGPNQGSLKFDAPAPRVDGSEAAAGGTPESTATLRSQIEACEGDPNRSM